MRLNWYAQCVCRISIKAFVKKVSSKQKARITSRKTKTKVLTKSKRKDLVTSTNEVDINILLEEVISHLQQDFEESPTFKEFMLFVNESSLDTLLCVVQRVGVPKSLSISTWRTEYCYKNIDKTLDIIRNITGGVNEHDQTPFRKAASLLAIKSEITLRDHFTQGICAVRHSLFIIYSYEHPVKKDWVNVLSNVHAKQHFLLASQEQLCHNTFLRYLLHHHMPILYIYQVVAYN